MLATGVTVFFYARVLSDLLAVRPMKQRMLDLHNYKGQLERMIERIGAEKDLSPANKKALIEFKDWLISEGIGIAKVGRYMTDARKFGLMLKGELHEATVPQLRRVIGEIEQSDLSHESKRSFKIMLRKLYRFIRGINDKRVYPEEVKWITISTPRSKKKLPEELLTEEEVKMILRNCETSRDRALFACLAESGCRVSEIGLMKLKHITFEKHGARLHITGKTGPRSPLILNSVPYLQEWLNHHPENDNPEAFVWYNTQDKHFLSYRRITFILKRAVKQSGIKKRVHLHLFRHSRATNLTIAGLNEAQLSNYLGWIPGSAMPRIYIHLSGKNTDDAILRANGLYVKEEIKEVELRPLQCMRCKKENEATNKFCKLCGFILDEEEAHNLILKEDKDKNINQVLDMLLKDKNALQILVSKIKESNLL